MDVGDGSGYIPGMKNAKREVGRPPKADKFGAAMSIQLSTDQDAAVESYRAKNGLRSKAEAIRRMIEKETGVK